jgi:hypothetical protein
MRIHLRLGWPFHPSKRRPVQIGLRTGCSRNSRRVEVSKSGGVEEWRL